MITNEQLKQCKEDCKKKGYNITMDDITYALLVRELEDIRVAYKCAFGDKSDFNIDYCESYNQTNATEFLKIYIDQNLFKKKKRQDVELSFDENKAEMIKLIKETQDAYENKQIDKKDALKIQAELRVKLNSQFNVSEDTKQQVIYVNAKYDAICPYCGREVASREMTKEEAMSKYNLKEE
jgi:hypothetical protein